MRKVIEIGGSPKQTGTNPMRIQAWFLSLWSAQPPRMHESTVPT